MRNPIILFALSLTIFQLSAQKSVHFKLKDLPEASDKQVGIRGNIFPLSWYESVPLAQVEEGYEITLNFADSVENIEFKFVTFDTDSEPNWEQTENRMLELKADSQVLSESQWNIDQLIDISELAKIPSNELMEDYVLVEQMVLEVHPGTYRYNDEETIQKSLAELKDSFRKPLTLGEAYLAMSKVTAQLKCDHTKVGFNNQNNIINSVIHRQRDKIPFTFQWINKQMIVIYNASENEDLVRGTSVLAINGVPVEDIYDRMMPYIAADGSTDQNRSYKMGVEGFDFRYNAFDVFYPLLFPLERNLFRLEIQSPSAKVIAVEVSALTRTERSKILGNRYADFPKTRDELWKFEVLENKVGMLTINSFGLQGWKAMTIDYKQFLADAFSELQRRKIPHLIIDIRKNNGGSDEMMDELYSYIKQGQSARMNREGRSRYIDFPESMKPFVQTWGDKPYYYQLEPDATNSEGYHIFNENYRSKKPKLKQDAFVGEVMMLTSAANTSLAFYTAYHFKANKLGTIIGQATGGNLNDINGGQILFLRLPNTQIEIDFPIIGGFTLEKNPDTGVQPDIAVKYTTEDIVNGVDKELEVALKEVLR